MNRTDYNLFSPEATDDPFSIYARLRDQAPVFFSPKINMWIVSRYDDIVAVLGDPVRFGVSERGTMNETIPAELADTLPDGFADPLLLMSDPQMHTRMRKLTNHVFGRSKMEAHEPEIRAITDRLIDEFVGDGRTDLVANLAAPIPLIMIGKLLGNPESDLERIEAWSNNAFRLAGMTTEQDDLFDVWSQEIEYYRYVECLVEERRASPREPDLLTELILARDDDGTETSAFTNTELVKLFQALIVAGNETTQALIGTTILRLLEYPEQGAAVHNDPSLISVAVEEGLRHSGPAKGLMRTTNEDALVGGVAIPKGQMMQIMFGSANRDVGEFQHPDEFDVHRSDVTKHLGFGKGVHFCLGAALARVETRIALERVLERLPGLRRASAEPPHWVPSLVAYSLARLDVEWDVRHSLRDLAQSHQLGQSASFIAATISSS